MQAIDVIAGALPDALGDKLRANSGGLCEVRLRAGQRVQFVYPQREELLGERISADELARIAASLMNFSLYAWEDELAQGFFTLEGGCRVGVCGRYALRDGQPAGLTRLQALCVRIARESRGCADPLVKRVCAEGSLKSLLVISRPGMGKTTCLRDLARQLSQRGCNVALADERGELAAVKDGLPALDVGERTDVMDMCPKHVAIAHMLRAMSPDVIITDELGDARDVEAVADAKRSGVAVIASAHADSIDSAFERSALRQMRSAFDVAALLGGTPGQIIAIQDLHRDKNRVTQENAEGTRWN